MLGREPALGSLQQCCVWRSLLLDLGLLLGQGRYVPEIGLVPRSEVPGAGCLAALGQVAVVCAVAGQCVYLWWVMPLA